MASKKDYRLSPNERPYLVQNIPPSQKRIHISFHADIHIGKKKYSNAIIGLTEHFIIPIVKGFFTGMKVPQLYHIIYISNIDVTKEDEVEIQFNKLPSITIRSTAVIHFIRSLIRNYVLGLPLLPPHKRLIFHSYDMSKFPLFKPRLSPSQLFQLQYNTECSYLRTNYFNDIVLYYYSLLYYGNPIFNANDLPVHFTEPKFGLSFSLDPILIALSYCPFTHIFSANSIKSPNLIDCAAKLATSNKSCKAIRIRNCGCTSGGNAFLEQFQSTDHDYPIYYDFGGNKLNDFPALFKSFELITAPVETLNFEDCGMNEESILSLFNAINENENLWGITELLIAGNYLNENCVGMLINLMNEFQKSDLYNIVTLSFGPTENIEKLTMMVDCCNQPFQHLRFYGTKITPDCTYDLCRFFDRTDTLKNIEFIDCEFEDENFQQILHTLTENKNITHISLNFSGCKLSGTKFSIFIKEISNGLGSKIYNLSLDRNRLTLDDLTLFNSNQEKFPVLSSLELNGNFNSILGMDEQIARLLQFPKLESLSLNGMGISTLRTDLDKLIAELKSNDKIKHIDISKNLIGEVGYQHFVDLIKVNNNLITAKFSSSEMKNPADVFEILEIVSHHKSLCNLCLFREDIIRLLSGQPPDVLNKYGKLLLKAQCKIMENCALIKAVPGEFEFAQTALSSVTAASISSLLQLGGAGIGGGGVSTGCPSIDDQDEFLAGLLDDSVYELSKMLEFVKPKNNNHLKMIQALYGIPFPFIQENNVEPPIYSSDLDNIRDGFDQNQNHESQQHRKNPNSLYVLSSLFGLVVDNSRANPTKDTVLCKSVLERRPDLSNELKDYDPSSILVQPSIKHKKEENDEEEEESQPPPPNAKLDHDQDKQSDKRRLRPEHHEQEDENELEDIHDDENETNEQKHETILSLEQPVERHVKFLPEQPEKQPVQQQIEQPAEKQPEQPPDEQQIEQPAEQQVEQPPDEQQIEQPAEKQPEQPVEPPAEQQVEQPPQQPVEQSSEQQQAEQPVEHHAEQPAEKLVEQPVEHISEQQPVEQHVEQPSEQPAEQHPVEHHTEQPSEQPAEHHTEQPPEQPVEHHTEQPSEQPAEQHTEQPPEQPVEQPVELRTEQPSEQPAEHHTEQPVEQPPEQPVEQRTEQPPEQPPEQPVEQHTEQLVENPDEHPAEQTSEQQPIEQPPVEQPAE